MAIEDGVDGAAGRNLNLTGKTTQQTFADFACAPVGLLPFEAEDGGLHLLRQLIAVTPGSARTVGQSFQTGFFVTIENLVAGLARDSELPTKRRHFLPVQQAGPKRTRSSITEHSFQGITPSPKGKKCHPCVRYKLSPMCQAAQSHLGSDLIFQIFELNSGKRFWTSARGIPRCIAWSSQWLCPVWSRAYRSRTRYVPPFRPYVAIIGEATRSSKSVASRSSYPALGRKHDLPPSCLTHDEVFAGKILAEG